MVSFVLSRAPVEWEPRDQREYKESYVLFDLEIYSEEYQTILNLCRPMSHKFTVNSIKRVQNPYQYGRFKLRQEMLGTSREVGFFFLLVVYLELMPIGSLQR